MKRNARPDETHGAPVDIPIWALLCEGMAVPTPAEELEEYWPAIWKRAVEVFEGDQAAARDWMDTPSERFRGERPLQVACRAGGEGKVLRVLNQMARRKARHMQRE